MMVEWRSASFLPPSKVKRWPSPIFFCRRDVDVERFGEEGRGRDGEEGGFKKPQEARGVRFGARARY